MCNLSNDLVKFIVVYILGVGNFKVDMNYTTLPHACFVCRGRGHIARYFPTKIKAKATRKDN